MYCVTFNDLFGSETKRTAATHDEALEIAERVFNRYGGEVCITDDYGNIEIVFED